MQRMISPLRCGNHETVSKLDDLVVLDEDYLRLRVLAEHYPLAGELEKAIVVSRDRMPHGVVTMNCRCVYVDENTGVQREVELVYPEEADPAQGRISVLAPVGSALLGLAVGSVIEWVFPDAQIHRLRVERVINAKKGGGRDAEKDEIQIA